LYLFTLIFLSVYAGAVLVLFLFVFMFLSSDTLFLVKFSNNSKMLLVFL
jgi:NADH:ubiquinone oxidoreductase subunit 6 (subunit J)